MTEILRQLTATSSSSMTFRIESRLNSTGCSGREIIGQQKLEQLFADFGEESGGVDPRRRSRDARDLVISRAPLFPSAERFVPATVRPPMHLPPETASENGVSGLQA